MTGTIANFPMWRPPHLDALGGIVDALKDARDLQSAVERLNAAVASTLNARACVLQRSDRGWTLAAQSPGGLRMTISDLQAAFEDVPETGPAATVEPRPIGDGMWTAIALGNPGEGFLVMLVAGDWTSHESTLHGFALLVSFALRSTFERELRHAAERLLATGYTMARRLSRRATVESVCQSAVEQVSRSLRADRVALALYRPEEDRLVVAATHGYPAAVVSDERIAPGAWVLGHVFAVRRPVVVRDVREIPGMSLETRPYRTYSFAAVPLLAGSETIGVLSATDKRDGTAFNRRDTVALRTFSVSAAVALAAARTDAEVHRLAYAATVDSLTGLFNRRYLDGRLHQEVERAKRASNSLTVLMADIDDFKAINDTHGHQVGDAILREVGHILRSAVRVFDICARYGGDEFAIIMPSSDRASAVACAERIRVRIAEASGLAGVPHLTMSIGVAVIDGSDAPDELIRRADTCLYRAKADGKNRVAVDADTANVMR